MQLVPARINPRADVGQSPYLGMILCYGEKLSSGVRVLNDTIVTPAAFVSTLAGPKIPACNLSGKARGNLALHASLPIGQLGAGGFYRCGERRAAAISGVPGRLGRLRRCAGSRFRAALPAPR